MKCFNCNEEIDDNVKFCKWCGAEVSNVETVVPTVVPTVIPDDKDNLVAYDSKMLEGKKKFKVTDVAMFLFFFVCCASLGLFVCDIMPSKSELASKKTTEAVIHSAKLNGTYEIIGDQTVEDPINMYLFFGYTCQHCVDLSNYLTTELEKYPNILIYKYEVWNNDENVEIMNKIATSVNTKVDGVPFYVIGDEKFVGFGEDYKEKIDQALQKLETSKIDLMKETEEQS